MQLQQIPLVLLGVKGFDYSNKQSLEITYNPTLQISNRLWTSESGRDTVSDCSTTSGMLWSTSDDEERDVDD